MKKTMALFVCTFALGVLAKADSKSLNCNEVGESLQRHYIATFDSEKGLTLTAQTGNLMQDAAYAGDQTVSSSQGRYEFSMNQSSGEATLKIKKDGFLAGIVNSLIKPTGANSKDQTINLVCK